MLRYRFSLQRSIVKNMEVVAGIVLRGWDLSESLSTLCYFHSPRSIWTVSIHSSYPSMPEQVSKKVSHF